MAIWNMQMALIARIQHPYIVEFKEAWVEKVILFEFLIPSPRIISWLFYFPKNINFMDFFVLLLSSIIWNAKQGCYVCIVTGYCEGGDM